MTYPFAYPDTCLLLPLFIEERGTAIAERLVAEFTKGGELPLVISELTRLEFSSVLSKYVRTGVVTKDQARQIITAFDRQCDTDLIILPVKSPDFQMARGFIDGLDTSLRSFDALHLAVSHVNKCLLLTADKQLAAAAAILGVEHYFVPYP